MGAIIRLFGYGPRSLKDCDDVGAVLHHSKWTTMCREFDMDDLIIFSDHKVYGSLWDPIDVRKVGPVSKEGSAPKPFYINEEKVHALKKLLIEEEKARTERVEEEVEAKSYTL